VKLKGRVILSLLNAVSQCRVKEQLNSFLQSEKILPTAVFS